MLEFAKVEEDECWSKEEYTGGVLRKIKQSNVDNENHLSVLIRLDRSCIKYCTIALGEFSFSFDVGDLFKRYSIRASSA